MQAVTGDADREAALTISNAMPEVERAARWLDGFAVAAALPREVTEKLQVVLDEVLTNVIVHGPRGALEGSSTIMLHLRQTVGPAEVTGWLTLEVVDDGPAFDPTARAPVDAATRVATGQVGGVGLVMVRGLMDKTSFARDGGLNRLTLWKRLPG